MNLPTPTLNPIIVKEFRSRMRGWRAFAILTFYLVFLALFSYGIYRLMLLFPSYGVPLSPLIGQSLFAAIANLSLIFVAFLMPALTATAISSEKEKLTLEMLQATPLSPQSILFGKLVASAGYIFLLLFAAVPLASLIFTFGGVTVVDLLLAGIVILATAITYGMIGLFFSAWRKRTIQALVLTYLSILLMIGGTYVIYIFWGVIIRDAPPRQILMFNPFSALASVIATQNLQNSPMGLFALLAGWGPWAFDGSVTLEDFRPLWHYTLAFYIGLSLILYFLATRFVKPIRPWRMHWLSVVLVVIIAILYFIISTILFYPDIKAEIAVRQGTPTPVPAPMAVPPRVLDSRIEFSRDSVEADPTSEPTEEATVEP